MAAAPAGLYGHGIVAEAEGRGMDAVRLYERAAQSGSGKAALRLGEIYDRGIAGVGRDYAQSLRWYNAARVLGEHVPMPADRYRRGDPQAAFERAQAFEREGRPLPALLVAYAEAASLGSREAVKRLSELDRALRESSGRPSKPVPPVSPMLLYEQAVALEQQGKGGEAVGLYARAARSGSGKAALRLGEIYDKGIPGVQRNYDEALKWFNVARVLGEDVPMAKSR